MESRELINNHISAHPGTGGAKAFLRVISACEELHGIDRHFDKKNLAIAMQAILESMAGCDEYRYQQLKDTLISRVINNI